MRFDDDAHGHERKAIKNVFNSLQNFKIQWPVDFSSAGRKRKPMTISKFF